MAKKKFFDTVKLETESKEPEKIIEIVNESSDSLKVPIELQQDEKTVIGIVKAEELQKAGWRLVSVTQDSENPYDGKTYKFIKEKK